MAVSEGPPQSMRLGDTVLLYAAEAKGYVFSELASSKHNSVALCRVDSQKDPNLPNVHFATFKIVVANKYKSQERLSDIKQRLKDRELTSDEKEVLLHAQKLCDLEIRENEAEQERLQGTAIVYGENVQLLHTLTKKYLAVNTMIISRTENTSLRVELQSVNSKGSIFKILPRYKVQSVGDEARYNDQVKFESLKTEGQFLHYSAKLFRSVGFNVHADCHELNLSATESAFTIIPHYRPVPGHKPNAFRAGGTVRLFHREYECYIAAEGSFARDPAVVEDVHCRKRHSDHGILKAPSTSANTYWQFEKESDPCSGEPLSWGERCRIKHLPTRKYLAVIHSEREYKVTLKDRTSTLSASPSLSITSQCDLDTVFSLFAVIPEGDTIPLESYARIKHLQTKRWLHLEKDKKYKRREFDRDAPGLKGLQWDGADLYTLTATETMNYDDAFTLEQVDEALVDRFNTVAGIAPILKTHITERTMLSACPLDARTSYQVSSALMELSEFLITANERETKNRQKLLRNLRILELMRKVLKLFREDADDASEQRKVCQACYKVIESYLKGDSRKNENYLARFIKLFQKQVHMGLNAEEVMIEMVEDNAAIVSKMAETELDHMIQQLVATKDHRILDFLGNLCVCGDRPIPSNQNAVLDKLHGKNVFYRMELRGSEHDLEEELGVMYYKKPGVGERWRKLADIAAKDVTTSEDYEFLKSQIQLFSKICKGNNARAIKALDSGDHGYMTFQIALQCAKDKHLHPSFRSKYVELIKVMYVDKTEQDRKNRDVLESLTLSFVYDKIQKDPFAGTGDKQTVALTGVENVNFPKMKKWILEHIKGTAIVVASDTKDNWLLAEVLSVLALLVKYGYYDDSKDVDAVLRPLVDVLNGFKDCLYSEATKNGTKDQVKDFKAKGRYQETQQNLAMFAIKERAMEVVELFFNFRFYIRLKRFIYDFRLLRGSVEVGKAEGIGMGAVESAGMRRQEPRRLLQSPSAVSVSLAGDQPPPHRLHVFLEPIPVKEIEPHVVQLARDRLKAIFFLSAYFFEKNEYLNSTGNTSFPDILIDLSKYQSDKLVLGSLHLLNRFYSAEVTLFEKAIQTQLLVTDESQRVFAEIEQLLPRLRHHLSIDAGESQRVEIIHTLNTFTRICSLQDDEEQPHQQNQNILYNFGVLSDVLNYVLVHAKDMANARGREMMGEKKAELVETVSLGGSDTAHARGREMMGKKKAELVETVSLGGSDMVDARGRETMGKKKAELELAETVSFGGSKYSSEDVLVACFRFLKALGKNNIQIQRRLYDRMDDLLEIDVAISYIADVLTVVFTGGPELCLKVREDQVEKLFEMVISLREMEERAQLILTLQAIAKVEEIDLPVKRNQAFIIKFFSKTREKFCDHLLGEGMEKKRWKLLTQDQETPDLQLLLAMTDLLATCCEGENVFIESVCQSVYSVKELLNILKEPYLPPERKRPFARFLVWVYMNTGGDKIQSGASELAKSKVMWDYLEHMALLLSNIGEVLRVMPHSEAKLVRHGLSSASRRYTSFGKQLRGKTPRTRSIAVPFVTGEDGNLLPGLLLYLSDGMFPLLKSFYADFFNPTGGDSDRHRWMRVSSIILTALLHLCDSLTQYFTTDSQVKLYRTTVLTIMNSGHGEIPLQVEDQVLKAFDNRTLHCRGIVTAAQQAYNKYYKAEIELNETFNRFASNFCLAYQGPNKASAQIGSKFDTKYSDLDDQFKKQGDEYLPLGPSFQEHVACFFKSGLYRSGHPSVKPEAERLIKQLEISFSLLNEMGDKERQSKVELDVKSLQILRAIIHNQIMHIDPNLREESPTTFRKRCKAHVEPVQDAIQNFGNAVSRIIPLLSHPNDEIVREVLAFLKAILFAGNRHVQKGLEYLLHTREEGLFTTMQGLLTNAAITHRERQMLLAQMEVRLSTDKMLIGSFKSIQGTGRHQISKFPQAERHYLKPERADEVKIDVEDGAKYVKGTELIALETITRSPPQEEASPSVLRSRFPMVSLEVSPPVSYSPTPTRTTKPKERRERASSQPFPDILDIDSRNGTLIRNTLARRSASKQDKKQDEDHPGAVDGLEKAVVELLLFDDSSHVKLALQVLGLMCDGQYRLMQNYLREQRDNIHTVNLVGEVALFIQHFYHEINKETVELVHLILQTLIEMCVGNYSNQKVIFNHQILEALNSIFQIDIVDRRGEYGEKSVEMKASAVELLEVMLEKTSEKTSELVKEIAGALDIPALHDTLADFYELKDNQEVKHKGFDDEAERGLFRTYHVLVHLTDYNIPTTIKEQIEPKRKKALSSAPKKESKEETKSVTCQAWEFCQDHSRSVEVFYKNMDGDKILTRVHFQSDPENKIREDLVERVKWNVNRDSPEDKLRDFLKWMKAVKKETEHKRWLQKNWLSHCLISFSRERYFILLFLSFLMNLLLLITYEIPTNLRETNYTNVTFEEVTGTFMPLFPDWFTIVLYIFGGFHLFFSLWMLIEYFVINWRNFVLPQYFYYPMKRWHKPPEETYSDVNIFGLQTVYVVLFVAASVLSLVFWGYFYCFCLLYIIVNNDILQRVLRSITKNGISLLWVAILGLVVLYIYSVVSFAFLHESLLMPNDEANLFCDSLFQCLITIIRYGLLENPGLAIPLVPNEWQVAGLRLLYDISFFIIVTTIGLNIVFGIIVDTFSELRDERGFDDHVENDHNMWNYIYFSMYLDKIDISDHNAIEGYVYEMIQKEKLEFFPLLAALTLGAKQEDETAHRLEKLETMVKDVLDHFKAEENEMTRRDKLQEQAKWEAQNLGSETISSGPTPS